MASDIEIANRAITKLGGARINSFDDDTTEGRTMRAIYETSRRSTIRRAVWNFAKKRGTLAASTDAPAWGFIRKFPLPVDFVRLLQVNDYSVPLGFNNGRVEDDAPYALEENAIFTNFPAPLKVRMLVDITDPTKFDSCFVECFACVLAYEGCETITQSNTKKQALFTETRFWLKEALRTNQAENPPEAYHDDSWLLSRY